MNTYGIKSFVVTSLILPLTLAASAAAAWYLKTNNPDNVDITQGLAYLRPILVVSFATFFAGWIIALIFGVIGLKKDESPSLSKLSLIVLALITVLSVAASSANNGASKAEDKYQQQKEMSL